MMILEDQWTKGHLLNIPIAVPSRQISHLDSDFLESACRTENKHNFIISEPAVCFAWRLKDTDRGSWAYSCSLRCSSFFLPLWLQSENAILLLALDQKYPSRKRHNTPPKARKELHAKARVIFCCHALDSREIGSQGSRFALKRRDHNVLWQQEPLEAQRVRYILVLEVRPNPRQDWL